jgi:hypothetical protein
VFKRFTLNWWIEKNGLWQLQLQLFSYSHKKAQLHVLYGLEVHMGVIFVLFMDVGHKEVAA